MPFTPFPIQNPNFAAPPYVGQPLPGTGSTGPANVSGPRMPVPAALAAATGGSNTAPRPTIRLQAPDVPPVRPSRQALPSPEALGVSVAKSLPASAPPLDWNLAHARLERLGALGFHLEHLAPGKVRATFMLPAGEHRAHQVEVVADNEAAAVSAALDNAEAWAAARK
jgi:hypothetical protein